MFEFEEITVSMMFYAVFTVDVHHVITLGNSPKFFHNRSLDMTKCFENPRQFNFFPLYTIFSSLYTLQLFYDIRKLILDCKSIRFDKKYWFGKTESI